MTKQITQDEWDSMREGDYAPYPVDGRVELKYRLLALTVFGVGAVAGGALLYGLVIFVRWLAGVL